MTLSTYIWQRLVLIGATLFDNFFLWSLKVHALKCTFRHPKIQILHVSLGDFRSSRAKV